MKTVFSIPGIHCAACATLIKDVSSEFPQISTAEVDIDAKTVALEHDEALNVDSWKSEIESLGDTYTVAGTLS